jgi:hypothetical protein
MMINAVHLRAVLLPEDVVGALNAALELLASFLPDRYRSTRLEVLQEPQKVAGLVSAG